MKFSSIIAAMLAVAASVATAGDKYYWSGNGTNWSDSASWSEGIVPNAAGAEVKVSPGTVVVDGDFTVGWIDLTNKVELVSDGTPRVLTLDSGVDGVAAKVTPYMYNWQSSAQCNIGDANLTLRFVSDALFTYTGNNSCNHKTTIPAKISGGTVENPKTVTFDMNYDWGSAWWIVNNTGNDFIGEIRVVTTVGNSTGSLLMGSDDSTLGNSNNEITLVSASGKLNARVCDGRDDTSKKFLRTVRGTGTIAGLNEGNSAKKLTLGDTAVVAPGTADAAGTIAVSGWEVRMDAATTFRLTLGADASDKVVFSPSSGTLNFTGRIEFDYFTSLDDVPERTPIELFTVGTVAFTFEPATFPDDFTYTVTGSKETGWSVTVQRKSSDMTAITSAASLVGDTFATLNASVTVPEGGAGDSKLVFAYGTTDSGEDFTNWEQAVTNNGPFASSGTYSAKVEDLTLDETYFFRAFTTADGEAYLPSPSSVSFTTRDVNVPDTFCWYERNGDWNDPANWYRLNAYARTVPGQAGDTLSCAVTEASAWTINLSDDRSFGFLDVHLSANTYNNTIKFLAPANAVTLTLDPGTVAATNRIISTLSNPNAQFGAEKDDFLTLKLAAPLEVYCPNEGNDIGVHFSGPLTGGTVESPCPIIINACNNYWRSARVYFENEASDFVGDIYVGQGNACQGRAIAYVGNRKSDAVLGDLVNRVILRSTSCLCYLWTWGSEGAVCNRTVLGNGLVRNGNENGRFDVLTDADHPYPLTLSATSRFEPCGIDGTGYGTISFRSKNIVAAAGSTFKVDLAPQGGEGDGFVFTPNAGGSVELNGNLEVDEDSAAAAKTGSSWTVVSVPAGDFTFVNNMKSPSGFTMTTTGDAASGWTVTLERCPRGFQIIVR